MVTNQMVVWYSNGGCAFSVSFGTKMSQEVGGLESLKVTRRKVGGLEFMKQYLFWIFLEKIGGYLKHPLLILGPTFIGIII